MNATWFRLALAALWLAPVSPVEAQVGGIREVVATPAAATPEQDDAALHAVALASPESLWAVGDRGAVWQSSDAGATWQFVPVPATESLTGVHFVTARLGWICGRGTTPYTRAGYGVLLRTEDGGRTWERLNPPRLPRLATVQFFDRDRGIVVGESSSTSPTGVLSTPDGGRTWLPVAGPSTPGWSTAVFTSPDSGILAGSDGRQAAITNESITLSPSMASLRGFHGAAVDSSSGAHWLVGDGGQVQRAERGETTWSPVTDAMPRETRLLFDFHAVAAEQNHVWAAGTPGTVVWHSPDAGVTWTPTVTGETTPIYDLCSLGAGRLVAVGALGKVLTSEDHGESWRPVRGEKRRLAALAIHAHASRLSLLELTRDGSERGYRVGAWALVRRDIGQEAVAAESVEPRFTDAALSASAAFAETSWRLPIRVPGLDRLQKPLLSEWAALTDQKFEEVFVTILAAQIRTWRPDVILLDDPPADDVPTKMIHFAMVHALEQAASQSGPNGRLWDVSGLPPWRPSRVVSRMPAGSAGAITLDPYEWLPHAGGPLGTVAADARARLQGDAGGLAESEAWQEISPASAEAAPTPVRDFFQGLTIPPGSEARRSLPPILDSNPEQPFEAIRKQRNFAAVSKSFLDDPTRAASLLGQLAEVNRDLPPEQAAQQLWNLTNEHRRRAQWDAAESTAMELVVTYGAEPVARAAARWLLTLWSSDEMEYQRQRSNGGSRQFVVAPPKPGKEGTVSPPPNGPAPVQQAAATVSVGDLQSVISAAGKVVDQDVDGGRAIGRRQLDSNKRLAQAMRVLELLEASSPEELTTPEIQFVRSSLLKRAGKFREADEIYTSFAQSAGGPWSRTAHGEIWLLRSQAQSPVRSYISRRIDTPPMLDGVLSDACWTRCDELRLTPEATAPPTGELAGPAKATETSARDAIALIAHDARFLYLAVSAPRHPGLRNDEPSYPGRPYDADLASFDRIGFAFDTNRDYASSYRFEVDQRGWTRDACWENTSWNPRWHVAANADERTWRLEIAIPWEELTLLPPTPGSAWAMGVVRTMPGVGRQSWQWPATDEFHPGCFGLLRFE